MQQYTKPDRTMAEHALWAHTLRQDEYEEAIRNCPDYILNSNPRLPGCPSYIYGPGELEVELARAGRSGEDYVYAFLTVPPGCSWELILSSALMGCGKPRKFKRLIVETETDSECNSNAKDTTELSPPSQLGLPFVCTMILRPSWQTSRLPRYYRPR